MAKSGNGGGGKSGGKGKIKSKPKKQKMAKNYNITTIKKAIVGTGGLYTKIAKNLNCEWHTAKKYVEMHDETINIYNNELEEQVDFAEEKLFENIGENDNTAIIFYLKTKGRHRGYIEKKETKLDVKGSISSFFDEGFDD